MADTLSEEEPMVPFWFAVTVAAVVGIVYFGVWFLVWKQMP